MHDTYMYVDGSLAGRKSGTPSLIVLVETHTRKVVIVPIFDPVMYVHRQDSNLISTIVLRLYVL